MSQKDEAGVALPENQPCQRLRGFQVRLNGSAPFLVGRGFFAASPC